MDLHICPVFPDTPFSDGVSVYSRGNMFEILETPEKTCLICTVTATKTRLFPQEYPKKTKRRIDSFVPLQPMSFPTNIRVFPLKHAISHLNTRIPTRTRVFSLEHENSLLKHVFSSLKHVLSHLDTSNTKRGIDSRSHTWHKGRGKQIPLTSLRRALKPSLDAGPAAPAAAALTNLGSIPAKCCLMALRCVLR